MILRLTMIINCARFNNFETLAQFTLHLFNMDTILGAVYILDIITGKELKLGTIQSNVDNIIYNEIHMLNTSLILCRGNEHNNSERSEECIDFTMIITSRNNAPISNYGGGFRCKSEYPWCFIEVKS
ncbi:Uncharacterized protein FWK35_00014275 [Aphis craccivora]|uniref:Uncharacterized protein n=1 Tax=Aphis craccivora TaxID=307492 RepID=A0A6G0YXT9_APHCR|nr:Uncharacterized protein FWK35_00014275 [Aphis craccivora]